VTDNEQRILGRVEGFISAIRWYGIWKDGFQTIGCQEHDVSKLTDNILVDGIPDGCLFFIEDKKVKTG